MSQNVIKASSGLFEAYQGDATNAGLKQRKKKLADTFLKDSSFYDSSQGNHSCF